VSINGKGKTVRPAIATAMAATLTAAFLMLAVGQARADGNNGNGNGSDGNSFFTGFEGSPAVFDDGVGVIHRRPSGSTAETDYAPGISASQGHFYARLTVQPGNNINGDQNPTACTPTPPNNPGAPTTNNGVDCDGPFTEWGLPWGGFDGAFDTGVPIGRDGSTDSVDIYLDTAFAATARASAGATDYRFDWDSDLLDSKGGYLQDYIFNIATGQSTDTCAPSSGGFYVIQPSNNSQRGSANPHLAGNSQFTDGELSPKSPTTTPQVCISTSGWYTFTHTFTKDKNNHLEVDFTITTAHGNRPVASWVDRPTCMGSQVTEGLCSTGAALPFSAAGANFLGWFPDQEIDNLAIDNLSLNQGDDDDDGQGNGGQGNNGNGH